MCLQGKSGDEEEKDWTFTTFLHRFFCSLSRFLIYALGALRGWALTL